MRKAAVSGKQCPLQQRCCPCWPSWPGELPTSLLRLMAQTERADWRESRNWTARFQSVPVWGAPTWFPPATSQSKAWKHESMSSWLNFTIPNQTKPDKTQSNLTKPNWLAISSFCWSLAILFTLVILQNPDSVTHFWDSRDSRAKLSYPKTLMHIITC